jgi:hypothetical protein
MAMVGYAKAIMAVLRRSELMFAVAGNSSKWPDQSDVKPRRFLNVLLFLRGLS